MTAWSSFYPDVLPFVPAGTPDPTVDRQVMRAAQEFFRRTRAWRATLADITTSAAVAAYAMPFTTGTQLVRLESAKVDGYAYNTWRAGERCSGGSYLFTPDLKTISFNPAELPVDGQLLSVTVTLQPTDAADGIDDAMYQAYNEHIANGAIARLAKDAVAQARFDEACDRINYQVWKGNAAITPRTRGVYF